ncbi:MAG: hypothetical protein JO129_04110 [Candidatus Dependentiae bacterium]|nr:hypothetical protein [Candidatus Dependentiae bacterium]
MKNIKIIALAMLFAVSGIELIQARPACPAGQKRNAQGKCVKASRVEAANKAKKAVAKVKNSNAMANTTAANNAIDAYNNAINASNPDSRKIAATQTAAINAINNLVSIYQGYLATVTAGTSAVTYTATAALASTGAPTNVGSSAAAPIAQSTCDDTSTAVCDDGSAINSLSCFDGSTPDTNGMCADGSLVSCNDGTSPACSDGTSPLPPVIS